MATTTLQEEKHVRKSKIPAATIIRLSVYQRYLKKLLAQGVKVVSSQDLASQANVNPAQLRKDLSYFGRFGVRGVGYCVGTLLQSISSILGVIDERNVILVGAGPITQALLRHPGFAQQGYHFEAVFDVDEKNIGKSLENGMEVLPLSQLPALVKKKNVELAVIAVPSEQSQEVGNILVDAGIKGILSFSPNRIKVPKNVSIQYVDFTILLDSLTYNISKSRKKGETKHTEKEIQKLKWGSEHSWPVVQSNSNGYSITYTS